MIITRSVEEPRIDFFYFALCKVMKNVQVQLNLLIKFLKLMETKFLYQTIVTFFDLIISNIQGQVYVMVY